MKTKLLCLLSALTLLSCGTPTSSSSSSGLITVTTSSETTTRETSSSESSLTSEKTKESEESTVSESSISSSERPVPGQGAWELTSNALPDNPSQGKHYNLEFSVLNGAGQTISFLGDAILKGGGSSGGVSFEGTIQLSKEEGNIVMTSGSASMVEFQVVRKITTYGGQDHDYTGTPTLYSADEMTKTNGEEVELERELSKDETCYIYRCFLPASRFRLANESGNVMYISYIRNLA